LGDLPEADLARALELLAGLVAKAAQEEVGAGDR
jgi:hypothetical protein